MKKILIRYNYFRSLNTWIENFQEDQPNKKKYKLVILIIFKLHLHFPQTTTVKNSWINLNMLYMLCVVVYLQWKFELLVR